MSNISHNLAQIRTDIRQISEEFGRKQPPLLLAVSKTQPLDALQAALAAGQVHFGENYAQELGEKAKHFAGQGIYWHFIGPIQSNKTRMIAEHADWVHSIDRAKIATRLSEQRPTTQAPLKAFIQVNIDAEATKSGVTPQQLPALIQHIQTLPNIELRGLMAIPSQQAPQKAFAQLRQLAGSFGLNELSMGMSADMRDAIAEGSTIVRIGTAIFGARPAPKPTTKTEAS